MQDDVFQKGDRVKLVAPFVWRGGADDSYWDEVIRKDVPDLIGTIVRERTDGDGYSVTWGEHRLSTDPSCIDHLLPEEEVDEAIRSIVQGLADGG